ncbi:MAG: SagB/ThcOx family dehydrogenase [Candidatus Bathyarchaeota archaeon]|nr:MAG: SagB/ThcOx family dehydrogenase [Candidatus Bathyarchaeota archaeon]
MSLEIGTEFMKKTQFRYMKESDQHRGVPSPPLQLDYDKTKSLIDLPPPEEVQLDPTPLLKAIGDRRSVRRYSAQPLTLEELSLLLWCTQGVKEVMDSVTLRTVPSAGARHALETYLLINRVQGLNPGLYRFLAIEHKLVEVNLDPQLADEVTRACLNQQFVKTCAVTFIWTAIPYRMVWRYGERGYRYLHIDVGHACQNLYLAAETMEAGVCAIGAFDDEALNRTLGIDGKEQWTIYLATVGKT